MNQLPCGAGAKLRARAMARLLPVPLLLTAAYGSRADNDKGPSAATLATTASSPAREPSSCPLRGAWQLTSAKYDDQPHRSVFWGGGSYTQQGNSFTETIEYFDDASYLGLSLTWTCKVEGNTFTQTGLLPQMRGSEKLRDLKLEEVYQRIE